jgi:hypothetical protein
MKKSFLSIGIIAITSLLMTGCSISDLLTKFASSDVELGAQEEYQQAKVIEAKKKVIEQKMAAFPQTAELKNVNEQNAYVAYAFKKTGEGKTQIDIEAMLPNPDRQVYEAWLRGNNGEKIDIGSLTFNQTDDYSLTYTTDKDISKYQTVMISREVVMDDKPETILMTGAFVSPSASPLTTSTH